MRTNTSARSAVATSTIAVDLGATAVRVVEMEFDAAGHGRLARRGSAPIPPGVWHDLNSNREALRAAITQALSSAGIGGRAVVACLPRRLVSMRFVRLPHAPPEQMRGMVGTIPMGRAGTAEDCVGAFLYLASDLLSGYVTGQILEVNGGQYMP